MENGVFICITLTADVSTISRTWYISKSLSNPGTNFILGQFNTLLGKLQYNLHKGNER